MRLTGRSAEHIALVEAYAKAQDLFRTDATPDPQFTDSLELDLVDGRAEPCRSAASAGSRAAEQREVDVRRRAARMAGSARRQRSRRVALLERRRRRNRHHFANRQRRSRRLGRDRGDHQLHQYVESVRDDRRRTARAQCDRARAEDAAVGQDVARAGFESRHRLPRKGKSARLARRARLQRRRLRLHDLHRQLGAVAARRRRNGRRSGPDRRRGALGQSQLRRTHPSAGARELSRFAAAGGRVRAGRPHGSRS